MPDFRIIVLLACICVLTSGTHAAPLSGQIPLPRHRPAIKGEKPGKAEAAKAGAQKAEPRRPGPLSIAPAAGSAAREAPVAAAPANARLEPPVGQAPILAPPAEPVAALRDHRSDSDIAARFVRGQAGHRSCAQEPPGRSDRRRAYDFRSGRPQARGMGDPAQRRRLERVLALCRLYCRQSELARHRDFAAPRRGGDVAGPRRSGCRHRFLPLRRAAHGQRAFCAGASVAHARRRCRRRRGATPSLA